MLNRSNALKQLPLDADLAPASLGDDELSCLIEALLLVAVESPTIEDIADIADASPNRVQQAVGLFNERTADRGWILQMHGGRLHLATAPRFAGYVGAFLGLEREGKLSPASLETLAIIAFQQPVTRSEIEAVRGVDCSGVLSTLHSRELIEPVSRLEAVGNPYQYGTTVGFLNLFGLSSLADLPPLGPVQGEDAAALLHHAMRSAEEKAKPDGDSPEPATTETPDRSRGEHPA